MGIIYLVNYHDKAAIHMITLPYDKCKSCLSVFLKKNTHCSVFGFTKTPLAMNPSKKEDQFFGGKATLQFSLRMPPLSLLAKGSQRNL